MEQPTRAKALAVAWPIPPLGEVNSEREMSLRASLRAAGDEDKLALERGADACHVRVALRARVGMKLIADLVEHTGKEGDMYVCPRAGSS